MLGLAERLSVFVGRKATSTSTFVGENPAEVHLQRSFTMDIEDGDSSLVQARGLRKVAGVLVTVRIANEGSDG